MKARSLSFALITLVMSMSYYGCVIVGDRTRFDPRTALFPSDKIVFHPDQAIPTRLDVQAQAGPCTVTYSTEPDGKLRPDTLKVISGDPAQCAVTRQDPPLLINGKRVLFIGATQFTVEGSQCFCWVDANGGAGCVGC